MSEMVDRVAIGMAAKAYPFTEFYALRYNIVEYYRDQARIAIAALREPTPEMVRALMIYADPTKAWQRAVGEALK